MQVGKPKGLRYRMYGNHGSNGLFYRGHSNQKGRHYEHSYKLVTKRDFVIEPKADFIMEYI